MAEMCIEPVIEEGRQRIVIRGFSLLKKEVGAEFDSPVKFKLCGEDFNLRLYPGGFNDQSKNWLGFYLKSHGEKNLPLSRSDYRIISQKEGKQDEVKVSWGPPPLTPPPTHLSHLSARFVAPRVTTRPPSSRRASCTATRCSSTGRS